MAVLFISKTELTEWNEEVTFFKGMVSIKWYELLSDALISITLLLSVIGTIFIFGEFTYMSIAFVITCCFSCVLLFCRKLQKNIHEIREYRKDEEQLKNLIKEANIMLNK